MRSLPLATLLCAVLFLPACLPDDPINGEELPTTTVELGGDAYVGADRDSWQAAFTAQARFLPEGSVQPVVRGEWARGRDPVAFDAGLLYVPHPSFHLRVAGRVEGQEWLAVASLSLVDEKPDQGGWSLD